MMEILGAGGVFSFVELEKDVHPVCNPVENGSSVE